MDGSSEEHEESQLFPHLEPVVQPAGEPGVLRASYDLEPPGQHSGEVAEGQGDEGVDGQGLVHVVHGNVVPQRPEEAPVSGPGDRPADLVLDEAQDVEEGEDGQVDVEGQPPVLEDGHGDVLNLPGGDEVSHVHRCEARRADDITDNIPGLAVVPGNKDLLASLQSSVLWGNRSGQVKYLKTVFRLL